MAEDAVPPRLALEDYLVSVFIDSYSSSVSNGHLKQSRPRSVPAHPKLCMYSFVYSSIRGDVKLWVGHKRSSSVLVASHLSLFHHKISLSGSGNADGSDGPHNRDLLVDGRHAAPHAPDPLL